MLNALLMSCETGPIEVPEKFWEIRYRDSVERYQKAVAVWVEHVLNS